jgi:hypothetical protein
VTVVATTRSIIAGRTEVLTRGQTIPLPQETGRSPDRAAA